MTKVVWIACLAIVPVSTLTAQTDGSWERVYSALMAQDIQNARGHANVGFSPAIISVTHNPFTATRTYTDQRTENGQDIGDPVTAECTIARDDKGRIHYEMAFESVEKGKLVIGAFDIQIYDPVSHTLSRYFAKPDHSLPSEPVAEVRKLKLMSELVKPLATAAPEPAGARDRNAAGPTEESDGTKKGLPPPPIKFIPTRDNLPMQSIDGIPVVIHRSILKYGDKQQFFQIQEDWLSPDYAMDLRRTVLRETVGKETVETKDIVQGAPNPALFEIPQGYSVHIEK
jgi:hypothetical protein